MVMSFLIIVWAAIWAYGITITAKHQSSFHGFILINSLVGYFMFALVEMMLPVA